jgi:hypothetical protein
MHTIQDLKDIKCYTLQSKSSSCPQPQAPHPHFSHVTILSRFRKSGRICMAPMSAHRLPTHLVLFKLSSPQLSSSAKNNTPAALSGGPGEDPRQQRTETGPV